MRVTATILLLTAFVAGCSKPASTEPPIDTVGYGWLAGTIIGAGNTPLPGATVTTDPPGDTALSDADGRFILSHLPAGTYQLRVSKDTAGTAAYYTVIPNDTTHATMRLPIWKLVWSDEFDGGAVDQSEWEITSGWSGMPDQWQYFSEEDAVVEGGRLRLQSQKREYNGYHYTSGQIISHSRWKYGRFEIRAKLPGGKGMWTAHWLWAGSSIPQEIDIMEMLGSSPSFLYMTYHFNNEQGVRDKRSLTFPGPDYSQDFHLYAVEWYPDEIIWFIDGVRRFRTPVVGTQEPLRIWLTSVVGGSWPGYPDSTTQFPQYHDIDYVRVYEAAE